MINIWSPARLADDLKAERLSERDKLGYLLFLVAFGSLERVVGGVRYHGSPSYYLFVAWGIGVCVWGTAYCFRVNELGDNRDFIARYICLAVPLGLQYVAAAWIGYVLSWWLAIAVLGAGATAGFRSTPWRLGIEAMYTVLLIIYFVRMQANVRRISRDTASIEGRD